MNTLLTFIQTTDVRNALQDSIEACHGGISRGRIQGKGMDANLSCTSSRLTDMYSTHAKAVRPKLLKSKAVKFTAVSRDPPRAREWRERAPCRARAARTSRRCTL